MAVDFTLVCLRLGVVMPPDDQEAAMDRNLRQIIFQAGILPYWVEHLGPAVTGYLERNACPDLEDAVRVVVLVLELVPVLVAVAVAVGDGAKSAHRDGSGLRLTPR